jgi:hypothetical protein
MTKFFLARLSMQTPTRTLTFGKHSRVVPVRILVS